MEPLTAARVSCKMHTGPNKQLSSPKLGTNTTVYVSWITTDARRIILRIIIINFISATCDHIFIRGVKRSEGIVLQSLYVVSVSVVYMERHIYLILVVSMTVITAYPV